MGVLLKCVVLQAFLLAASGHCLHCPDDIVGTSNGLIKGTKKRTVGNGDIYYAYKGIPYAKPPIGHLRFEPPQPIGNWFRTLDATKEKDICSQLATTITKTSKVYGSEDCLYLNIYTPVSPRGAAIRRPLAVMVWFHGGGFFEGDNHYDLHSPDYLLEQNVIVVTIAFRLGIFGFYSTGDLIAPGNYGLKDQILALRWVKDNIRNFGGDPKRITLFGASSGAASVNFLTQTPLAKGLYHRIIMQGSSSLCDWSITERATELAYNTAQLLNISVTDNADLKYKLKVVDYELLLTMSSLAQIRIAASDPITSILAIAPVIEPEHPGAVIKRPVYETMINGDFNLVPILMGINAKEGGAFAFNSFVSLYLERFELASGALVPDIFGTQDAASLKEIGDRLKTFYFGNVNATNFKREQLYDYNGDLYFAIRTMQAARISANFTNVYFYVLSYLGELGDPQRPTNSGPGYAEEMNYLFYRRTSPVPLVQSDLDTRARMVKMWTNFAKTSNPTPEAEPLLQNVVWKKIDENFNYLDIGVDLIPSVDPHHDSYQLWIDLFAEYGTIS